MPNRYAEAVRELVQAKVAQLRPSAVVELETGRAPPVVNIMKALKESMQSRGREKASAAVRRRMGKRLASASVKRMTAQRKPRQLPTAH